MFFVKSNKFWNILVAVILALQVAAETWTVATVLQLNMLPGKYIVVLAAVMVFVLAATCLLAFVRVKGKVGTARRITACILALLIAVGCAVISNIVGKAYDTVSNVTNTEVTTNAKDMYILVRAEDEAKSLADTKGYVFAAIKNYNVAHTDGVIIKIEESSGETPRVNYYEQNTMLADALFGGEADGLIMNGASIALLIENEVYANFFEKARILITVSYSDLNQEQEPTETTEEDEEANITNTPFVVYVSGSDTRSDFLAVSRSDVNILMVVNPVSKQVLLLNTPRDYYVPNPAGNGALDKLTHCGLYGTDCSMEALEGLYGIEIQHYGQINFTGFKTLIDAIGGITVYSDQAFTAGETHIQKGENFLNGNQALNFARDRYHVSGGDNGRGKNQMKVITAVINKMTSGTTIISNYSNILKSLEGTFSTDLQMSDINQLVKMQLSDMATWNIQSFAVFGTGGSETTYSSPSVHAYVMYPNEDVVQYASGLIQKVLNGDILTTEDVTYSK